MPEIDKLTILKAACIQAAATLVAAKSETKPADAAVPECIKVAASLFAQAEKVSWGSEKKSGGR